MLAQNSCPAEVIQNFVTKMGISPTGTGKYEVRQQLVKDSELLVSITNYADEAAARKQFDLDEVGGNKMTFALLVGPDGKLVSSKGCPLQKSDVQRPEPPKRKWVWPVVIGVLLIGASAGIAVYFVRRKRKLSGGSETKRKH